MTKAEYSQRTHLRAHSWDTYGRDQYNEHCLDRIRWLHLQPRDLGQALECELATLNWALDRAFEQAPEQLSFSFTW